MPFRLAHRTLACVLLSLPAVSLAQTASSGALSGSVSAPDGHPLPAAAIALTGTDGPSHTASSSPDGSFRFNDLASGIYTLKVTAPGFTPQEIPTLTVATGRTTHIDLRLTLASAQQSVTVTATQTSFDPTQTSSVVNIDRDRVEELPIPSRNYLTFVLLSPQVAAANPALPHQVSGSFSFGGLRPGSNAVYLDDVNDNDEFSGSSRTQLSPEAINDFQIVNHGFAAQSGGGAGGAIDVQTRAGLNRIHGDAFTFVQNGALNATPPLELAPTRPAETRVRAGLALGGPIQRDRTFYYLAAEQEIAHGQESSDLKPATIANIDSALQLIGPLKTLTLQSGFFPTSDQETEISGRIDRVLTTRQSVMLRYAFTNSRNVNDAFNTDELSDRTARGSSFLADNSLNGTLTSTFADGSLNELSFELAQRRAVERTEERTQSSSSPGILIPGIALFGTPYFGNSRRFETHLEFADAISIQRHRHLFQAGLRADRVALRASVPDASQGLFVFATLADLQVGNADTFTRSFGIFATNFAELRLAAFLQDHWTPTPRLTLDYGLRYDLNRLPTGLPQHALNLSPRLGLAWTPLKSLVIRSGFGTFYDRFQLATINQILDLDGTHAFSQIVEGPQAAAIYQTGTLPSAPLSGVAPSIAQAQPSLHNPYSEVASFSLEQALPLQTTLTAEYQFVHGVHLGRTTNSNLPPPVLLTTANAPALGVPSPTAQQLNRPYFTASRLNPAYDAIDQFATAASSTYHGGTITLNRQFQDDLQILVGYTFSKTLDDASSDPEQPQNPYTLRDERALSLQNQRHRFTLSGLWLIGPDLGDPADAAKNANPGTLMKIVDGFEFAPIVSIASGFRANPATGLDSAGEHIFPFTTRPAGLARNSLATPANVNLDLRVLRMVPVGNAHLDLVAESFNLLNHPNVALLNTAFGSSAQPSAAFGHPIASASARRIQFSLDFEF